MMQDKSILFNYTRTRKLLNIGSPRYNSYPVFDLSVVFLHSHKYPKECQPDIQVHTQTSNVNHIYR